MNAAASIAAPNAAGSAPGVQGGLFAAAGAKAQAHGPMAGFEALLAALFGDQGQGDALGLGAPSTDPTKAATASKPGSKAGTMDDALTPALEAGPASDGKTADGATVDPTAAAPGTGVPADAQALAALLAAAGATKVEAAPQTTAQAPAAGDATAATHATAKVPPGFDKGLGQKIGLERRFGPAAATNADAAATDTDATQDAAPAATDAKPAEAANSKARLIELAQQLAAGRNNAVKLADPNQPKPYVPPTVTTAANAQAPAATPATVADANAAQAQAQAEAQAAANATDPAAAAQAAVAEAAQQAATATPNAKPTTVARFGRADGDRKDGAAPATALAAAPSADGVTKTASAIAGFTGQAAVGDAAAKSDKPADAKVDAAAAAPKAEASEDLVPAQAQAAAQHQAPAAAHAAAAAAAAVRGAPETVANLAAQIIKKLDGRSTRFDVQLHPAELGRVDVRLEIGATGKLTASMSFDNPQAAADLRSRADELQKALENAGFDLSGGLSFDVAGDRGGQGQSQAQQDNPNSFGAARGRAFETALATAGESAGAALAGALNAYQTRTAPGLDIRI